MSDAAEQLFFEIELSARIGPALASWASSWREGYSMVGCSIVMSR